MGKSSTGKGATATKVRSLRTLLAEAMTVAAEAAETPAICARIRQTRERLKDQWSSEHPGERGNPFTQEAVASRLDATVKTYRSYEATTEPKSWRLREIAVALGLDGDYFLPSGDLASATARLEAEADRLKVIGDDLQALLAAARAQLDQQPTARASREK